METKHENFTPSRTIPVNPEIAAELARSLMEMEKLREPKQKLEVTSTQIVGRVDQLLREQARENVAHNQATSHDAAEDA